MKLAVLAAAALTVASVFAFGSSAAPTAVRTLRGTVGPGFSISLTQNGKRVRSLPAGTYRIVVSDRSPIHNFVLEREHGGDFERAVTSVPQTGSKTITVRLTRGDWEVYCAPHQSTMSQDFVVR
jgi:hypothetical protein